MSLIWLLELKPEQSHRHGEDSEVLNSYPSPQLMESFNGLQQAWCETLIIKESLEEFRTIESAFAPMTFTVAQTFPS